ncbi:MAG: peptidase, partial [Planctomycetes bacterium]|nr:peptidase [Planctomycetota bacterium]
MESARTFQSQRILAILVWLAAVAFARAGSPSLSVILPRGGQRGTEIVANFHGARLENPLTILCYRPGITLKSIEAVKPGHVKCTLTIAADCPLGVHPIRLVTAAGVTDLRLFSVGNCPEI